MNTPKVLASLLIGLLIAMAVPGAQVTAAPSAATAAPVPRRVAVTGEGVATYPAFNPAISRYAVTTTPETAGTITFAATSPDPDAVVRVDGVVAASGHRTVTGLEPGDEVAVFIDDARGHSAYSYVYLPDAFPRLQRVTPTASAPTFDHVLLTLGPFPPRPTRTSRSRSTRTVSRPTSRATPPAARWT